MSNPTNALNPAARVGFVGLGAMGWPMAKHLNAAGLLKAVANRSFDKARLLAEELGVSACASMAEMVKLCDVIVLCVTADADVLANCEQIAAAGRSSVLVIDHSTVSSITAKQADALLQKAGCSMLDAPVSGGVEGANNGKLSIMAGGSEADFARAQPVLAAYGLRITLMGEVGAGQNTKAVNQVLVAGIAQAVCEGLALSEKLGLKAESLLPTLGAGAAGCWFLEKRGATMLNEQYAVGFKLSLLHKDLKIVRELARHAGTDATVIEKSLDNYATLMQQGHGDEDISALIRLKRPSA